MRLLSLLLLLGVIPNICLAQAFVGPGEWCLVLDEIEDCSFNTVDGCYAAAGVNGGYCQQNARKARVAGVSPWCVVSAAGRDCSFYSQQACLTEARAIQGGCVPNTERALEDTKSRNEFLGLFDPTADMESGSDEGLSERLQEARRAQEELMQGEQQ